MRLTPLKAIRKYCVKYCMNGMRNEVKLCPSVECSLYYFRSGKKMSGAKTSSLKAIRLKCLNCAGTSNEIEKCNDNDCLLYTYKSGKNPNLKGLVNKGHFKKQKSEKARVP